MVDVDIDRGAFGPLLRGFRRAAGLSQEELAERAGLSVESVSALERGRRRAPYRETIALLARGLALSDGHRRELEVAAKQARGFVAETFDVATAAAGGDMLPGSAGRHNLVRPLSSFHGRERDRSRLIEMLSEHRLVSITGAGGIGKTRLAVETAWSVVGRYPDGVWFVDLAPLSDADVVVRSVVDTLDIPSTPSVDAIETLRHHLARRDALIVIDNCEHVIDEVARLIDALLPACPALRVLATSREPLHIAGERVYRVPTLAAPVSAQQSSVAESLTYAAVALYVERAGAANAAFVYEQRSVPIVAEICRRLDGIALAIELAASQSAVLSSENILKQLERHFDVYAGGSRTALPRQRTMYEAIRWSYDRLAEPEKALFRLAGTFVNGFTFDALREVGANGGASAIGFETLAALVDKSLIVADVSETQTRYRLLAPIRAQALEFAREAGEAERYNRGLAHWCLQLVTSAHVAWETAPSEEWLAQVEPELDNLRAGLIWTLTERNDVDLGREITARARRVWARLRPVEGRRWVEDARRSVDEATPARLVSGLALTHVHLLFALQQYRACIDLANEADALFERGADDAIALAELRGFHGFALVQLGRGAEGEALIAASATVFERRDATQLAAHAIGDLAIAHLIRGDVVTGSRLLNDARELFRSLNNERGVASVSANLAEAEFAQGHTETALALGREALDHCKLGREVRMYLANVSAYLVAAGRFEEAREHARASILAGGLARTDVDVAFALQHLAAVAVCRPHTDDVSRLSDMRRAVQILGFVDARFAALAIPRQYTEQQEYEMVKGLLHAALDQQTFADLQRHGATWNEEDAVSAALAV